MAPVLEAGLSRSSINRNFPRAVLYGPKEEGGLNMWNLYDYQNMSTLCYIYMYYITGQNIS